MKSGIITDSLLTISKVGYFTVKSYSNIDQKVECVFRVVFILPLAEFGWNNPREDAPNSKDYKVECVYPMVISFVFHMAQ